MITQDDGKMMIENLARKTRMTRMTRMMIGMHLASVSSMIGIFIHNGKVFLSHLHHPPLSSLAPEDNTLSS